MVIFVSLVRYSGNVMRKLCKSKKNGTFFHGNANVMSKTCDQLTFDHKHGLQLQLL